MGATPLVGLAPPTASGRALELITRLTAPQATLFAHSGAFSRKYVRSHDGSARYLGIPVLEEDDIQEDAIPLVWTNQTTEIFDGLCVTGEIPRTTDFEDTGGPFFLDPAGEQPDIIPDDLAMWIETPKGLLVVCGCCHSGLINTIDYIRQTSGESRIFGIVGGLHLKNSSAERLTSTTEALREWNPEIIVPCHCTGDVALDYLKQKLDLEIHAGFAGFELKQERFK